MGQIRDSESYAEIMWAFSEYNLLKIYALRAFGYLGDRRAVDLLINELYDSLNRLTAVEALGMIGDSKAIDPLLNRMNITIADHLRSYGYKPDLDLRSLVTPYLRALEKLGCDKERIDALLDGISQEWRQKGIKKPSPSASDALCPSCGNVNTMLSVKGGKVRYFCPKCRSEFG